MIDKNSQIPIYIQLEEIIKDKIDKKEFRRGEALPTERELTDLFSVSRMTLRQVISNLVNKGVLYKIPSKGTYVSKEVIQKNLEIQSFSEDMIQRGFTPGSKVIRFEIIDPDEDVTQKLALKDGEKVYFLERIRLADNEPMAIEYCYLPEKYFKNITKYNMEICSLYTIMKDDYNVRFDVMKQTVMAKKLSKDEANMLLGKTSGVGLYTSRIISDIDLKPIEYTKTVYNAERYKINFTLSGQSL